MAWSVEGRRVLVTGATSGIGEQTALELARRGARVVLVGRDAARGAATQARIATEAGAETDLLLADLAEMASVRRLAEQVRARYDRLDVLVNNAGLFLQRRQLTGEGLERTFATNHLSMFLLTGLLRDLLVAGAPARVVNVSSEAHRRGRIDLDDLQSERRYRGFAVYSASKLMNVLITNEFARRLDGTGVTANSLHPGFVRSNFGRNNGPVVGLAIAALGLVGRAITVEQGARTSVYAAADPSLEGVTGRYLDRERPVRPADAALDEDLARRLWDASEQLAPVAGS